MMTIGDYKNFNSNGKNMVYGICYKSHCICGKSWFSLKYRMQPISMMRNDLWLNSRKRMLGWKRRGVQKKKRWVFSYLFFFFFRLLFGLLGDFVCCRCCCCFLLSLLCFFTLHGCYLKVTYKVLAHHPWSLFRGLLPCLCNTNTILPMSLFHPPPQVWLIAIFSYAPVQLKDWVDISLKMF